MILIAIENIVQRKGLETLVREINAHKKILSVGNILSMDKVIRDQHPSLIFIHSAFTQHLRSHQLNEETVSIIRIIDKKPDQLINDNPQFDILYLDDDEHVLTKNIKRNIALCEKQVKPESIGSNLSEREQDILREIALGKTNKEIADNLFISAHTVITHRKNITRKLGIKTVSGLTVYAILNKIIQMDEM